MEIVDGKIFSNGWTPYREGDKMSYMDINGNIMDKWFDWCGYFNDGMASVGLNGKSTFIDPEGNLIGDGTLWFKHTYPFSNGLGGICNDEDKWTYIDKSGNIPIGQWYDHIGMFLQNGKANVCIDDEWFNIDKNGNRKK